MRDKAKRESTGQLLLKCARLWDEAAIARINREAGAPLYRPVHTKLFPHIALEGTRLGTLAERLGVSKQAVSQWVAELVALGVLELCADADDRRAKRVRFTARGVKGIHQGLAALGAIEAELAAGVGARRMAALGKTLAAILPKLEALAGGD
jgi:DNA-binding MarR family transcriptional regulator